MCKKHCEQKCKSCIKNLTDPNELVKPYNVTLSWKEEQAQDDVILELETLCKGITSAKSNKDLTKVEKLLQRLIDTLKYAEHVGVTTDAYKDFTS